MKIILYFKKPIQLILWHNIALLLGLQDRNIFCGNLFPFPERKISENWKSTKEISNLCVVCKRINIGMGNGYVQTVGTNLNQCIRNYINRNTFRKTDAGNGSLKGLSRPFLSHWPQTWLLTSRHNKRNVGVFHRLMVLKGNKLKSLCILIYCHYYAF